MLNHEIGMLTTVLIGNTNSFRYLDFIITPRGYKNKYDLNSSSVREGQRPKLVERVACLDDHRLVYARITDEGRVILQKYHAKAEDNITNILDDLPPQELVNLLQSLELLAGAIKSKS